jgi:hypothetical protein
LTATISPQEISSNGSQSIVLECTDKSSAIMNTQAPDPYFYFMQVFWGCQHKQESYVEKKIPPHRNYEVIERLIQCLSLYEISNNVIICNKLKCPGKDTVGSFFKES